MKMSLLVLGLLFSTLAHATEPQQAVCDSLQDNSDSPTAAILCARIIKDGQFDPTATKTCLYMASGDGLASQQNTLNCLLAIKNKKYDNAPITCIDFVKNDHDEKAQESAIACLKNTTSSPTVGERQPRGPARPGMPGVPSPAAPVLGGGKDWVVSEVCPVGQPNCWQQAVQILNGTYNCDAHVSHQMTGPGFKNAGAVAYGVTSSRCQIMSTDDPRNKKVICPAGTNGRNVNAQIVVCAPGSGAPGTAPSIPAGVRAMGVSG